MLYELRINDAVPGKLPALHDRFAKTSIPYFEKYGIKVIGFWTDEVGFSNRLQFILGFENADHYERAWSSFRTDPERVKAYAATETDGPLVIRVTNTLMRPTAYSPLQ